MESDFARLYDRAEAQGMHIELPLVRGRLTLEVYRGHAMKPVVSATLISGESVDNLARRAEGNLRNRGVLR